jgi:hypothetical protein
MISNSQIFDTTVPAANLTLVGELREFAGAVGLDVIAVEQLHGRIKVTYVQSSPGAIGSRADRFHQAETNFVKQCLEWLAKFEKAEAARAQDRVEPSKPIGEGEKAPIDFTQVPLGYVLKHRTALKQAAGAAASLLLAGFAAGYYIRGFQEKLERTTETQHASQVSIDGAGVVGVGGPGGPGVVGIGGPGGPGIGAGGANARPEKPLAEKGGTNNSKAKRPAPLPSDSELCAKGELGAGSNCLKYRNQLVARCKQPTGAVTEPCGSEAQCIQNRAIALNERDLVCSDPDGASCRAQVARVASLPLDKCSWAIGVRSFYGGQ